MSFDNFEIKIRCVQCKNISIITSPKNIPTCIVCGSIGYTIVADEDKRLQQQEKENSIND